MKGMKEREGGVLLRRNGVPESSHSIDRDCHGAVVM